MPAHPPAHHDPVPGPQWRPTRRAVGVAAAWTIPAVTVAAAAPAHAASGATPTAIAATTPTPLARTGFVETWAQIGLDTFTVKVTGAGGVPVSGVTVAFALTRVTGWSSVVLDNGLTSKQVVTDSSGVASVGYRWSAKPAVLDQLRITATAGSLTATMKARYRAFTRLLAGTSSAIVSHAVVGERGIAGWGYTSWNNMGDGGVSASSSPNAATPVLATVGGASALNGTDTVVSVATGTVVTSTSAASWAMTSGGTALSWGGSQSGPSPQAGRTVAAAVPVAITGGWPIPQRPAESLVAGAQNVTCVVVDGIAYTCGTNGGFALGSGSTDTTQSRATPTAITPGAIGSTPITAIAGGTSTFIVIAGGRAYSWGSNGGGSTFGLLGNNTNGGAGNLNAQASPVALTTGSGTLDLPANATVTSVAMGGGAAALVADGEVYTWGNLNVNGTPTVLNRPQRLSGPWPSGSIVAVSCGFNGGGNLALGNDGRVYGWGSQNNGQLGNQPTAGGAVLPLASSAYNARDVAAIDIFIGNGYSLVLYADGTIYGAGSNVNGRLGNGTTTTDGAGPITRVLTNNLNP